MKRLINHMAWWMAGGGLFLLPACDADYVAQDIPVSRVPIEINTNVEGDASARSTKENAKARLLFWTEEQFEQWLSSVSSPKPAFEREPDKGIDDYTYVSGTVYPTGESYLPGDAYYYVTGYAPVDALTPSDNYTVLTVNDGYKDGKTDFLSCDGDDDESDGHTHKGSANDRFTKKEHELQFRHLTARIRFVVIREADMDRLSVSSVKVTLPTTNNLRVPVSFNKKVDTEQKKRSTYIATLSDEAQEITIQGDENPLAVGEEVTLGSCYVLQSDFLETYDPFVLPTEETTDEKTISLTMNIKAQLMVQDESGRYENYGNPKIWENQTVEIKSSISDKLYPGYEYVVMIHFNYESLELQGFQCAWEDGGIHTLPIRPQKGNTSGEGTADEETDNGSNE